MASIKPAAMLCWKTGPCPTWRNYISLLGMESCVQTSGNFMIRYNIVYLTCSKKLMEANRNIKEKTT